MRKISYMYQISGGTNYRHFCEECVYCQKITIGKQTQYACTKHPEQPHWNPAWLSCKHFSDVPEKPIKSKRGKMTKMLHQMTIMEFLGGEA